MIEKQVRCKDSVALTDDGVIAVKSAIQQKYGTINRLMDLPLWLSESTVKRFVAGKFVSASNFKVLMEALDIPNPDDFAKRRRALHLAADREMILSPQFLTSYPSNNVPIGLMLTARFTDDKDKRRKAEIALTHLRSLLLDAEISCREQEGSVVVIGHFSEGNKALIEDTLFYLKGLMQPFGFTMTSLAADQDAQKIGCVDPTTPELIAPVL